MPNIKDTCMFDADFCPTKWVSIPAYAYPFPNFFILISSELLLVLPGDSIYLFEKKHCVHIPIALAL